MFKTILFVILIFILGYSLYCQYSPNIKEGLKTPLEVSAYSYPITDIVVNDMSLSDTKYGLSSINITDMSKSIFAFILLQATGFTWLIYTIITSSEYSIIKAIESEDIV